MKLAVLGAGKIVGEFLPEAKKIPGLELAAIYGRRLAAVAPLAEEFGIPRVYTDVEECLADPEIDTVWVAVPNTLHYEFSRAALLAGKHVICEKPFVLESAQLDSLAALARERGLILVEAITTVHSESFGYLRGCCPRSGRSACSVVSTPSIPPAWIPSVRASPCTPPSIPRTAVARSWT
ncbi:1,5-anhydro-D-fructose reductase [Corynebacterium atrinae]|uniref:Gfo/Idh/MocA family protein n=1 Tax=Corynebacterium atrinae TaxID=1336740 RepID=UPI0025B2959F|nr:Gfo/Idh/MocA family oxidoreductase [Corynebacterium atrinae]WJY64097.1 1,5-anhydro-D-fructose reductase [Corynebacterium atrinae]